ncbi:hypothetical protein SAY86_030376 [Trapa natans]|uniref:Senescence regulator S40 n=1 Tax=Trapa natans TaxID=22666 RepID=A0AAN7RDN5_TRANT|nr:hypothetical protein SAY86_030376 [Trapa natans]
MAASRMIPRGRPFSIGNSFTPTVTAADPTFSHPLRSTSENIFEFDESDIWASTEAATTPSPSASTTKLEFPKKFLLQPRKNSGGATSSSLPVNVPDWSKILKGDYDDHRHRHNCDRELGASEEEDDDEEGSVRIPPHEYLAMRRGASFSVHEGIGRTLKGRDLRRVRNAVWKKVNHSSKGTAGVPGGPADSLIVLRRPDTVNDALAMIVHLRVAR